MSKEELRRVEVLSRVDSGLLTAVEAATLLELSVRQLWRILAAYRQEGPAALAHGNRGRQPAHTIPTETRQKVVELATSKYQDYNHQHLSEVLRRDGVELSRSSVRRILTGVGLKSPRKRRPPKHRQRRERYAQEGMLVQIDGSPHDWLEGRGPRLTLHIAIDDATGKIAGGKFRLQEDAAGYIELLRRVVSRHGIPLAVYHDRHDIFVVPGEQSETIAEQLAGTREPTQVGRLLIELGIRSIKAHSPQAKGRVERLFQTLQDRLVKALREAGAKTLAEADVVLESFIEEFNQQFAVEPAEPGLAYRAVPTGFRPEEVFCFKYLRTVAADNTVRFAGQQLQILESRQRASYARVRVEVHERLDGSLAVYHDGRCLATKAAAKDAKELRARHGPRPPAKSLVEASGSPEELTSASPSSTQLEGTSRKVEESKGAAQTAEAPTSGDCQAQVDDPVESSRVEGAKDEGSKVEGSKGRKPVPSYVDKWTGERVYRPSTPAQNHRWREPYKRATVTESRNA